MNRIQLKLLPRGSDGEVKRVALNSPLIQGSGETEKYYVDFTDWGASSSTPCGTAVVTVHLNKDNSDVTATIFAADDATVVSDVEVEFTLSAMSRFKSYRVFVKVTVDSLISEMYCDIRGER